ncbi:glucan phosphoethanolaminetransferase (alkaline phosphatase superfamily) [Microbacterium sp. W4I4]|uniref:hypothetical protein n=1 Tax=Microbacterium sp. W4I4 TaxID=3042295 RepID=UPI00277FD988|nr:hypothetical protein [Microbacterium sp. W4I4]MDQ0614879.1 glucan phosphoethanolaminetransferase (alkaline phosphatase superfamily) [Microbacterium sp. W4I4]
MNELFGLAALAAAIAGGVAASIGLWLRPKPVVEYWRSLVNWGIQLLLSMAAVFWVGFLGISTPGCSPNCDWGLLEYNFRGFMIVTALIQLVTLLLIVALRRHRRVRFVPLAGVAVTIGLCVVSSVVAYKAMLFF